MVVRQNGLMRTADGSPPTLTGGWPTAITISVDLLEQADQRYLKLEGTTLKIECSNGRAEYEVSGIDDRSDSLLCALVSSEIWENPAS